MNISERLRSHKENNTGFIILSIMTLVFASLKIYETISLTNHLGSIIFSILVLLPLIALVLVLEKKGASFAAHFIFFSFFIADDIASMFVLGNYPYLPAAQKIKIILGFFASIYVILKLLAHKYEIKGFIPGLKQQIIILIILSLLDVYFTGGFSQMSVSVLIYAAILSTTKSKESLLYVMTIFSIELLSRLNELITSISVLGIFDIILSILSIFITGYLTYYAYVLYKNDLSNNQNLQYYS